MKLGVYILVMAGVTYLIRAIPFTLFRKKIKSPFFRSLLLAALFVFLAALALLSLGHLLKLFKRRCALHSRHKLLAVHYLVLYKEFSNKVHL